MGAPLPLERLIERARRSDRAALGALYEAYADLVFGAALHLLDRAEDAEDLTADVFVGLPDHLRALEFRNEAAFESWLRRTTVRAALHRLRRRRRRRRLLASAGSFGWPFPRSPASAGHTADLRLDLERALSALPDPARRIVVLRDVEGYTHAEIARLLGIEEATSRSRLKRARRSLRRILRGHPERTRRHDEATRGP